MTSAGPLTIAVLIKQVQDAQRPAYRPGRRTIVPSQQLRVQLLRRIWHRSLGAPAEAAFGGEIVAVAVGPPSARDAISRSLAMGADRGIHLELPDVNATDTLGIARLLSRRSDRWRATSSSRARRQTISRWDRSAPRWPSSWGCR